MSVGKHHPKHPDFLIVRLDSKKAWRLSVPFEDDEGEVRYRQREFADAVFGGKRQALKLIREERDTFLQWQPFRKYYDSRLSAGKEHVGRLNQVTNKTQVVGVNLVEHYRGTRANFYFRAQIGDETREQYSLRRHGARKAFELAVLKRYEWLEAKSPSEEEIDGWFHKWLKNWEDILRKQEVGIFEPVSTTPRWQEMSPDQLKQVLPTKPAGEPGDPVRLAKPGVKGISVRLEIRKRGCAGFFVVLENNRIRSRINWDKGLSQAFAEAMRLLSEINEDPALAETESMRRLFGEWIGTSRHAMERADLDMNPKAFLMTDEHLVD